MKDSISTRLPMILVLLFCWAVPPRLDPEPKVYWHITLLANLNGTAAQEWLWATMVEMPKEKAYPQEAQTAKSLGGRLQGTILALVRGAAWRSAYSYTLDTKCKGRKSKTEISYGQSQSDRVFVHGQLITPRNIPGTDPVGLEFRWGVCNSRVLMEDGSWRELEDMAQAFLGPIRVEGREAEEMRGDFEIDGVIYDDQVRRVKRCGESWIEDFDSVFKHFERQSLIDNFLPRENGVWGQRFWKFHSLDVQCVYDVIRSSEREHPYWKQRRMD